LLVPDASYVA